MSLGIWRGLLCAAVLGLLSAASLATASAQKIDRAEAMRFLQQASFGPTEASIQDVMRLGYGGWLEHQFALQGSSAGQRFETHTSATGSFQRKYVPAYFWEQAIYAPDQLRARTTFALSQIVVAAVSNPFHYKAYGNYLDMLQRQSFGNYCDLIREVSFSPAMAHYLTFFQNKKADPQTGRAPDENYARELLQLFTIGVEELRLDGRPKGRETYTSADVEGLASVFTGFALPARRFKGGRLRDDNADSILVGYPEYHEPGPKTFLGTTIPGGLRPEESVQQALDHILAHPNVAPFISKQLIQKFVTSNPSRQYIRRVAIAFNEGRYVMPSGKEVGEGRRCDMRAAVAATLLDQEARQPPSLSDKAYGKVRDPILRIAHTMRALKDPAYQPSFQGQIIAFGPLQKPGAFHGQLAFVPPSVFSFYRPGFVAAGTQSAQHDLVAPEMQLYTSDHIVRTSNFASFLFRKEKRDLFHRDRVLDDDPQDARALVDRLEKRLLTRPLSGTMRRSIIDAVSDIGLPPAQKQRRYQSAVQQRLTVATMMIISTPQFVVQR